MLEQQHWVWDWSLFQHGLISIVAGGSVPFARVSRNNVTEIGQALDAGMLGIVVPMVHTAEDARRAGEAVRYPPRGVRSLGATHAQRYGPDYMDWADDQILMMVQIESRPGRRQQRSHPRRTHRRRLLDRPRRHGPLHAIGTDVAGTDAEAAYAKVVQAAKNTGKFAGMSCGDGEEAAQRIRQGMLSSAAATTANGSAASVPKTWQPPAPPSPRSAAPSSRGPGCSQPGTLHASPGSPTPVRGEPGRSLSETRANHTPGCSNHPSVPVPILRRGGVPDPPVFRATHHPIAPRRIVT